MAEISDKEITTMIFALGVGEADIIPAGKVASALQELKALRAKLAAAERERDEAKRMMLAHMEIGDKLERERDAERAHNAVLRHVLECLSTTSEEAYEMVWKALHATQSDSAERVRALVELLQDAVSETENGEKLSVGFCLAARDALAEWRNIHE